MRVTLAEKLGKPLVSFEAKTLPRAGDFITYKASVDTAGGWEEDDEDEDDGRLESAVERSKSAEGEYVVESVHHTVDDSITYRGKFTMHIVWLIVSRVEETAPADKAF